MHVCTYTLPHLTRQAFYGVCLDAEEPLLLTELLEGGSLHDRLYKDNMPRLTHPEKRGVVRDVAAGLLYMHGKDVSHLDLKPHNVLLTKVTCIAKLCDFGLTRVTRSSVFNIPKLRPGGTPLYMSPEQHRGWFNITTLSDVYSFGVLLNELETHSLPWIDELSMPPDQNNQGAWILKEIRERVLRGDRPRHCASKLIGAIVQACWVTEASDRPGMAEVLYGLPTRMVKGQTTPGWKGLADVMDKELNDDSHCNLMTPLQLESKESLRFNFDLMFDLKPSSLPRKQSSLALRRAATAAARRSATKSPEFFPQ
jgi:serine/threonine protein kinase